MVPESVLAAYGLVGCPCEPMTLGHINLTFRVENAQGRFVLQRLHPVFDPIVHEDIEAVTSHLVRAGLVTPRLVRTRTGALWVVDGESRPWRLLTYIEGSTHLQVSSAALCREAGAWLGTFHSALRDLSHRFRAQRLGVHDTAQHLARLREALAWHAGHVAYPEVQPVARAILDRLQELPPLPQPDPIVAHGDPKISNFLFSSDGRAVCLIDLDTVARMNILHELGDAFRSWCSPHGEADARATFDVALFAAGLASYREHSSLLAGDALRALPQAIETISLELAARFARDALEEQYFAWDKTRFDHAWQHHVLRAHSQLALAQSVAHQSDMLARGCS